MIKAYNLETKELVGKYDTMEELAEDFKLSISAIKAYFQRYKVFGEARIKNHNTDTWCYLEKPETKRMPNYKERCLQAIEYIKQYSNTNYLDFRQCEIIELLEILGDKE